MAQTLEVVKSAEEEQIPRYARDDSGEAGTDFQEIEKHWADLDEVAEIFGVTYRIARYRAIEEKHWITHEFPSRKQRGKWETRVRIKSLPKNVILRLKRLRNRKQREEQGLAKHHGGLVLREDDGRLSLSRDERAVIEGLYMKRQEPSVGHIVKLLARDCIRCHAAPMAQMRPGADGRYGLYRCENESGENKSGENEGCGLEFSYTTIWRMTQRLMPEASTRARKGINAGINKSGIYHADDSGNYHRSERVFGDHHKLDIWTWDEHEQCHRGGEPKLSRPWLSAWQDRATGVAEWRIGARANADLLSLAFRSYSLRFGLPEEAWMDNGEDYCSAQFQSLCGNLGTEIHHTLPSKRTGESHGKSKPIERWFGTLERDFIRTLPGWCGSSTAERPDDVLWPQVQQHKAFVKRERKETPFLSVQELEKKLRAWHEEGYLKQPSATADAAPMEAFKADLHPLNTVKNERAMDVLLWRAKTRMVGRNGVSVSGRMYWSEKFFGLRGLRCTARWDPGDLGRVIVSVHRPGKADQMVIATAEAWLDLTECDYERFRELKKQERQRVDSEIEELQRAAAGVKPYDQMLEEAAAKAGPMKMAVNGDFGPTIPVITEGHRIARALATETQRAQRGDRQGLSAPSLSRLGLANRDDSEKQDGIRSAPTVEEIREGWEVESDGEITIQRGPDLTGYGEDEEKKEGV